MDIQEVMENFRRRGYSCVYFDTGEQAARYLLEKTAGKTVSFGGSVTLSEIGAYQALGERAAVRWHWKEDGYCQDAEVYISSANALSEKGDIVNIDGRCNRVAGTLYGAESCYFVCGINKLCPTLEDAIFRARNVAAPKNAKRLGVNTPCAKNGDRCYDCASPERICRAMVILTNPPTGKAAYEVVFIGQTLGF